MGTARWNTRISTKSATHNNTHRLADRWCWAMCTCKTMMCTPGARARGGGGGLQGSQVTTCVIDPEDTGDREERDECVKMHDLIKEYKLQGQSRNWTSE